ncbi:SET domain-containing protein [Trichodelitschia bisporula]|uniref:SET domain-containing protein n=1 Tax=Trichodelitschia bisporula TaxID=703511 RepID=A0A6G1I0C1_9PEZI|nr:SET domain-containing protein [Trichodelitschia bisporula]
MKGLCPASYLHLVPELYKCGASPEIFVARGGDHSPWTSVPQCVPSTTGARYCAFTNKDFAEGRGIAIVTTPAVAEELAKKPAFADPVSIAGMNDLVNPPWGPPAYEMRPLAGRGFGMIANRTIVRGERLMQETPSFIVDRDMFDSVADENRLPLQWNAVYQLPEVTREEFLALHKHAGGDEIDDVMRTNAFGAYYGDEFSLHNNVLPRISRFNHDCRPNAHYYFDPDTMTQYVHAVRDIYPGEEILINYTDSEYTFAQRQHAIHLSWGFNCTCSICRQPADQIAASDDRLGQIAVLRDALNDWTTISPHRAQDAELLVALYEMERLHVPVASGYEAAAYAWAVRGDEARTRMWAAKAVEAMTILYGGDHELTKDLGVLMRDPKNHRTWLYKGPQEGGIESGETRQKGQKEAEPSKWSFF